MPLRPRLLMATALLCLATAPACLLRSRHVESRLSPTPLKTATQQELIERMNRQAALVHTMNATVDIDTSVGGQKKGKVTEYQQIRGYVLAEKPSKLHMIGLLPVVRTRAFDMVSTADGFRLWIPPKNRFIVGSDEVTTPSANALENLRPSVIYDALLLHEVNPANEIAVLESGTQIVADPEHTRHLQQADYRLNVLRRAANGQWYLQRRVYFDRSDLRAYHQSIYDRKGDVVTDVEYSQNEEHNGISFPSQIDIVRPVEEYTIGIHFLKLTLNEPLRPDQFELQQPDGVSVTVLDGSGTTGAQK